MRIPVDPPTRITPHGEFAFVRKTKADGACGWQNKFPCVHWGLDIAKPKGTAVYAPERMTVVAFATDNKTPPLRGYGPGAIIAIGASGVTHVLAHLDPAWWKALRFQVPDSPWEGFLGHPRMPKEGRVYAEGEQVGTVAKDHLHWEVRLAGKKIDPRRWLAGKLAAGAAPAAPQRGNGLLLLLLLALASSRRK